MKIRITITQEMEVELEHYPGCKTLDDIAKCQQEMLDEGECMIEEILTGEYDVLVEAVE